MWTKYDWFSNTLSQNNKAYTEDKKEHSSQLWEQRFEVTFHSKRIVSIYVIDKLEYQTAKQNGKLYGSVNLFIFINISTMQPIDTRTYDLKCE